MPVALVGNTRALATIAGLDYLVREILPRLTDLDRDCFEFHIHGGGQPPEGIKKRLLLERAVVWRGFALDFGKVLLESPVVLVPTPIELGFRTRIAESFAYGRVVIAHRANASGMPELVHDENILLFSNGKEALELLRRVRNDKTERERLATSGRETYLRHYASSVACNKMIELFESIGVGQCAQPDTSRHGLFSFRSKTTKHYLHVTPNPRKPKTKQSPLPS